MDWLTRTIRAATWPSGAMARPVRIDTAMSAPIVIRPAAISCVVPHASQRRGPVSHDGRQSLTPSAPQSAQR